MRYKKLILLILGGIIISGCCDESDEGTAVSQDVWLTVVLPVDKGNTRATVKEDAKTLALIPTWNINDKIRIYAAHQVGNTHTPFAFFGDHSIGNISEDGRRCEFNTGISGDFANDGQGGKNVMVYGVCGKESSLDNNEISICANLYRTTMAQAIAPVWFMSDFKNNNSEIECKYLGTFELLHIKNNSNQKMVFKWNGYEANQKWYYEFANFLPETMIVKENSSAGDEDVMPVDAVASISPGEESTMISWFIPNGKKMKDAALLATIDGKEIKSISRKSSSLTIEVGHAYHLYAHWDGKNLYIDSFDEQGIKFGDIPNHDL